MVEGASKLICERRSEGMHLGVQLCGFYIEYIQWAVGRGFELSTFCISFSSHCISLRGMLVSEMNVCWNGNVSIGKGMFVSEWE